MSYLEALKSLEKSGYLRYVTLELSSDDSRVHINNFDYLKKVYLKFKSNKLEVSTASLANIIDGTEELVTKGIAVVTVALDASSICIYSFYENITYVCDITEDKVTITKVCGFCAVLLCKKFVEFRKEKLMGTFSEKNEIEDVTKECSKVSSTNLRISTFSNRTVKTLTIDPDRFIKASYLL